jgi:hypothetical protein
MFWTTHQIVYFVIEKIEIQSNVNFEIVKIDDVIYEELFNLSVYESIRENCLKITC